MRYFDHLNFKLPVSAVEVVEKRTSHSKLFAIPGDESPSSHKLVVSMAQIHYDDAGTLEDVDLSPVDMGTHWEVNKAVYTLRIEKSAPEITYSSPKGDKC